MNVEEAGVLSALLSTLCGYSYRLPRASASKRFRQVSIKSRTLIKPAAHVVLKAKESRSVIRLGMISASINRDASRAKRTDLLQP
jgi:hypothetical protein